MSPMNNRRMTPMAEPGILDFAPGAAAAYSLRNLSLSYSAPVVTVRRSTDSAEADFTATEVSDGTLAAWCAGGDGFVKQWWSQTGMNHVSNSTAAQQPKIVASGVLVTDGGKPALQFDGVDDYIATSSTVSFPAVSAFACIVHRDGGKAWKRIVNAWTSTSVSGWFLSRYSTTNDIEFRLQLQAADGTLLIPDASLSDGERCILSAIYGDADATLLKNNAVEDSVGGLPGSFAASAVVSIGGRFTAENYDLVIQELIIYPTDQTAQRTRIEGNLNRHFGVF